MPIPTIFIAIANEYYQTDRRLPALKAEASGLQTLLLEAENQELCKFVIIQDATYEQVVQVFQQQKFRDNISIFHFAGHGGSEALFLNNEQAESTPSYRQGLVKFLANQRGLQLVFLNACFTERIAQSLIDVGIPAVVGTESAVLDSAASNLALCFYRGLARGLTIDAAWQDAKAVVLSAQASDNPASFYQPKPQREDMALLGQPPQRFPWSMLIGEGKSLVKSWSLPSASRQLLFGLPDIIDQYDLHSQPFRYLEAYQEKQVRNFFGRSAYIQKIFRFCLSNNTAPLLLFYGQSGVGKSSLLQAGLLPRLKQSAKVVLRKRDAIGGLSQSITDTLIGLSPSVEKTGNDISDNELAAVWRSIETVSRQPLVIIIDQAEELFTLSGLQATQELAQMLSTFSSIFGQKAERPKGKLILSYRKEFHPEFEDAVTKVGIAYNTIFVKRLEGEEIIEVVESVAATPEHRAAYNVAVESNLANIIAADLLKDVHSPIAPVLQILLSKMWESVKIDTGNKQFSISLYRELQRKGIFLNDFYREQMEALTLWSEAEDNKAVTSGLALDILHFHTADFGTAKYQHYDQILDQYHHQQAVLPALLMQLKDLYLLADASEQHTTLAHDTLAPIIQQAIKESNLPGQRAYRLLEAKKNDFEIQPEEVILEANDLAIIEEGQRGMRAWMPAEQALIDRSRKKREQQENARKRTRQLLTFLGVGVIALAILSSIAWWRNSNKAMGNELLSQALQMENIDPVRSLALAHAADDYLGNDPVVQNLKHDIYSYQAFYGTSINLGAPVSGITLADDGALALLPVGNDVQRWDLSQLNRLDILPHDAIVQQVAYAVVTEDIISSTEQHLFIWNKQGRLIKRISVEEGIYRFAVSPNAKKILIADQIGGLWLLDDERLKVLAEPTNSLNRSIAFTNTGDTLLVGNEDGLLRMMDTKGNEINSWQAQDNWVLVIEVSADGNELLTGGRDGLVKRWTMDGELLATAYGHEKRVNTIQLLGVDGWLTAGDDGQVRWWDSFGQVKKVYRGHADYVYDVAAVPDSRRFYSVGADSTLRVWRFHSTTDHILSTPSGDNINCLAQAAKTGMVVAGTRPHLEVTGDDFFDFEDAIEFGLVEGVEQPLILWENENVPGGQLDIGHIGPINSVAVAADGKTWVSGGEDGFVNYYNENGEVTKAYESIMPVNSVALTDDGKKVGFTADYEAVIWQPILNDTLKLQHSDWVSALVFSPDAKRVYTAAYDSLIRVFDTETGQLLDTLVGHRNWISSLAISPDGRELLSGDWNNEIIRWSVEGRELNRYAIDSKDLTGGKAIFHLTYSGDGKYFAFTTEAGVTQVVDRKGNAMQSYLNYDHRPDNGILFSVDGRYLIRAHGHEVYYWKLLGK